MKLRVLLQLAFITVVTFSALAFLQKNRPKQIHCTIPCTKRKCCPREQKDSSENIFFNPINRLVAVVSK